jgi:sugar phosphate isomerase/epimerase
MTTRHTAFDRGMVGDGVIDFRRIRSLVDGTGYAGPIEIEVLSEKDWWARDLDTVLSTARARINLHLGEAQ